MANPNLTACLAAVIAWSALTLPLSARPTERRVEDLARARAAELLPIGRIAAIAQERYAGSVIDAEIKAGKPHERTPVVYELRLLTERGHLLRIRIDAFTGDFLEVDGRGLLDARRRP